MHKQSNQVDGKASGKLHLSLNNDNSGQLSNVIWFKLKNIYQLLLNLTEQEYWLLLLYDGMIFIIFNEDDINDRRIFNYIRVTC